MRKLRAIVELITESATRWSDDKCHRLGASLAYYALFSLFPLLMLAVTGLGFFLGDGDATRAKIVSTFNAFTGVPGVSGLVDQTLLHLQEHHTARGVSTAVGLVAFVLSASAVFGELDTSLNKIWRCPERSSARFLPWLWETVRDKAVAMLLVLAAALGLLASLIVSTGLYEITDLAGGVLPPFARTFAGVLVEHLVSLLFLTAAITSLFKVIPERSGTWRDVAGGGFVSALLLTIAKGLVTLYLTKVASYDAYGAVGAILALLLWIYLVSLLVLFGAELSRVYAERHGSLAKGSLCQGEGEPVAKQAKQPHDGKHAHSLP